MTSQWSVPVTLQFSAGLKSLSQLFTDELVADVLRVNIIVYEVHGSVHGAHGVHLVPASSK